VLLLGAGVGFYASTVFNEVAGIDQSTAPDLAPGTNPVSLTAPQGSLASFTVSLASLNSFAGNVNLAYSISPAITNATIALNPDSVSLLTETANSTLSMSLPSSTQLNSYNDYRWR